MPRLLRVTALAVSGITLLWLAGCGKPAANDLGGSGAESEVDPLLSEMQRRDAERLAEEKTAAAKVAEAEKERLMSEAPSEVGKGDYERGSKLQSSRVNRALGGALAAGEHVQLQNIQHNLEIHGMAQGYPKSHEEFMRLVTVEWGMQLPELQPGYEYWYDAGTHKILKRPTVQAEAEAEEDGSSE